MNVPGTSSGSVPLVSVLVPAYNHERFVDECLDSVLATRHPRIELLVVDDGSSDGTCALVSAWIDRHRDHFERAEVRSRPNVGICATLNELVAWSTGDYVCILASDDALLPDGVGERVRFLQSHHAYEAVVSDAELMDESSVTLATSALAAHGYRPRVGRTDRLLGLFLSSWTSPFQNQFFRADWLRANPYPSGLGFEDLYSALHLGRQRRLGMLPVPTIRYRVAMNGRTAGRLPAEVIRSGNLATIERAVGDLRLRRPSVAAALSLARRKSALQGRADWRTWTLRLSLMPVALRYRRLMPLLRSQLG